jgi:hypothetical protein
MILLYIEMSTCQMIRPFVWINLPVKADDLYDEIASAFAGLRV